MPQKHQDTKIHKTKIIKLISLVKFSVLVLWRQKITFRSGLKLKNIHDNMKWINLIGIFLLSLDLLPVNCWSNGPVKDPQGESFCYVYISVSKEKKIVIFKLDPIKETLILTREESLPGEPGSLCINPSHKTMYAALRSTRSVACLDYNRSA